MLEERTNTVRSGGDGDSSGSSILPGANDRLLAVILRSMFAGIMLVRASDSTILCANARFSAMFGYAPGELEGRPVAILNAPGEEAAEEVTRRIIIKLKTEGVWKGEVENVRKDGTRFWCEASVTTFEDSDCGTLWVTVQLDISARKHAEAELRRSEERLGLVLEATGGGAWDWNIQTGAPTGTSPAAWPVRASSRASRMKTSSAERTPLIGATIDSSTATSSR